MYGVHGRSLSEVDAPEPGASSNPLRLIRRGAGVVWVSGLSAAGLVWCQHHWQVLHPHPLPLLALLAVVAGGAALTVRAGTRQILSGPRPFAALAWSAGGLLPVMIASWVGVYALGQFSARRVPNDPAMNLAKTAAASFFRAEAAIRYPRRVRTRRLVMFYDALDHPRRDAEAMDAHLARLEKTLGGRLRARVFWVRGHTALMAAAGSDLAGLSFSAIALGSDRSPGDWEVEGWLDRHELAHAALDEFRDRDADPPFLLHEGWAVSQSGVSPVLLALHALEQRRDDPALGIRDMVGPDWYHRDYGPVYPLGGAFVAFLIREYGAGRFLRLYNEGTPSTFDDVCRDVFGADLGALENAFWKDAVRQARPFRP